MIKRKQPATIPKSTKRRGTPAPLFVCLPKAILQNPPIAHRNKPAKGLLTVFEVALATGIVSCAYRTFTKMRHRDSHKAGSEASRDRDEVGAQVAASERADLKFSFKDAMSGAYWTHKMTYKVPDVIALSVSKSALLKAAKLSRGGKNHKLLGGALKRLQRPVRIGLHDLPTPLLRGAEQRGKKLSLSVSGKWLQGKRGMVPLPVPTQGNCTNALALFLFLAATDQRTKSSTNQIETEKLCRRIGLAFRYPAEACEALRDALASVNTHLKDHCDLPALVAAKLPVRFELVPLKGDDRLRFEAVYDLDADAVAPKQKAKAEKPPEARQPAQAEFYDDETYRPEPELAAEERLAVESDERKRREQNEFTAFKQRLAGL